MEKECAEMMHSLALIIAIWRKNVQSFAAV